MEIKILKDEYLKGDQIYTDFIEDKILGDPEHFTKETVTIGCLDDFPIYLAKSTKENREDDYLDGFLTMDKIIVSLDRKHSLDSSFWYSYILTQKSDYIKENYPEVFESETKFKNAILKKFDWENYIYKLVIGTQYVIDNIQDEDEQIKYFKLISNNLDVYNYIIKYEVFRNDIFLVNIMKIINENDLSEICKAKIKYYTSDERFGRKVIFELNKSYPMVMVPLMEYEELEAAFIDNLNKYLILDGREVFSKEKSVPKKSNNFFNRFIK